jgi:hypothetical protein
MTVTAELARDVPFTIGGHTFQSRLFVGTGKYRSHDEMVRAIEASGAEVVTAAATTASSIISIPSAPSCSPTPPGVTPRRTRSATPAWRAKRDSTTS